MRNTPHLSKAVANGGRRYSDEYYTPSGYYLALGPFDLDPCAGPSSSIAATNWRSWPSDPVERLSTLLIRSNECWIDDGLAADWSGYGLVWLNPPYSRNAKALWLAKLAKHEGGGIALVPAATDTTWFQEAAGKASAVLLVRGRVQFTRPDGKPSANAGGSAYMAFGDVAKARLIAAVNDPHNPIKGILFFP